MRPFSLTRFVCRSALVVALGLSPLLAQAQISADTAARIAQQEVAGRVLSVDQVDKKDRTWFRVKLLDQSGSIVILWIDAETGAVR